MKIKLYSTGRQTGDQTIKLVKERAAYFIYLWRSKSSRKKANKRGKKEKKIHTVDTDWICRKVEGSAELEAWLQAKKTICCTDLLALKPSKDEKHAAPGSGIATMSPAVGRVMVPIACAIIFQAPGNNDVYYFQLHPYAVFFLRSLLLPEFRSNTCDRIPPPQQLKKESRKSCPTNHKPHNSGLNLGSASGGGWGGCGKIPLHGGQSFPRARRNPNICTRNANHVYSHFSLQRKERKARENKIKTWETEPGNAVSKQKNTSLRNKRTWAEALLPEKRPKQQVSLPSTDISLCLSVSLCVSPSLWDSLLSLYWAGRDRSNWSLNPT